jgi:hypothetical protein
VVPRIRKESDHERTMSGVLWSISGTGSAPTVRQVRHETEMANFMTLFTSSMTDWRENRRLNPSWGLILDSLGVTLSAVIWKPTWKVLAARPARTTVRNRGQEDQHLQDGLGEKRRHRVRVERDACCGGRRSASVHQALHHPGGLEVKADQAGDRTAAETPPGCGNLSFLRPLPACAGLRARFSPDRPFLRHGRRLLSIG